MADLQGTTKIEVWHETESGRHCYSFPMGAPVDEVLEALDHWKDTFERAWAEQKAAAAEEASSEQDPEEETEADDNGA